LAYISSLIFQEHKRTEEKIKECEKLWKNLEAELVAIFHGLIKKGGQPFTDLLKIHLECSICKGLINSVLQFNFSISMNLIINKSKYYPLRPFLATSVSTLFARIA